jgi:hypothetical protein
MWGKLTRFLEYPELELSNNLAENSMRPVALGRKNWIHVGSSQAGPKIATVRRSSADRRVCRLRSHRRDEDGSCRLLSHAERYFSEVVQLNPQDPVATAIVAQIDELFAIDAEACHQGLSTEARHALRQQQSRPLTGGFVRTDARVSSSSARRAFST